MCDQVTWVLCTHRAVTPWVCAWIRDCTHRAVTPWVCAFAIGSTADASLLVAEMMRGNPELASSFLAHDTREVAMLATVAASSGYQAFWALAPLLEAARSLSPDDATVALLTDKTSTVVATLVEHCHFDQQFKEAYRDFTDDVVVDPELRTMTLRLLTALGRCCAGQGGPPSWLVQLVPARWPVLASAVVNLDTWTALVQCVTVLTMTDLQFVVGSLIEHGTLTVLMTMVESVEKGVCMDVSDDYLLAFASVVKAHVHNDGTRRRSGGAGVGRTWIPMTLQDDFDLLVFTSLLCTLIKAGNWTLSILLRVGWELLIVFFASIASASESVYSLFANHYPIPPRVVQAFG